MKLLFETTRWLAIGLASALALGCGGGGGGGGGSDEEEILVLPVYAYEFTSTATDPLRVLPPDAGGLEALEFGHVGDGPGIFGTYTVADGSLTMAAGSTLVVTEIPSNMVPYLYGDFTVEATETWILPPDGPPTQGAFRIEHVFDYIYAEVTGAGSLQLRYDFFGDGTIDDTVTLTWQEVDELEDSDAPDWQKLAAFAIQIGGDFVPELMGYGIGSFDLVMPELANASPVTVTCDAFSDLGLSVPPPPPTYPDAGQLVFTWEDDAANGDVGPGDSFEADWDFCLMIVPPVDEDQVMLEGILDFNSYTEVVQNNTLVRIGYEGTSPADRPGGLVFTGLHRYEVYDADGPGGSATATVHLGATLSGRMTLVFTEPAN